jgi:hypothetical protein
VTDDQHLIAWLCIMEYNFTQDDDPSFHIPSNVRDALEERGWVYVESEEDWQGLRNAVLTDAGRAVIDLNGAEWGLETLSEGVGE